MARKCRCWLPCLSPGGSGFRSANHADGFADRNRCSAPQLRRPDEHRALANSLRPDARDASICRPDATHCSDRYNRSRLLFSAPNEGIAMSGEASGGILPVSNTVLFPGVVLPITVTSNSALAAAQETVRTQRRVGLIAADGARHGCLGRRRRRGRPRRRARARRDPDAASGTGHSPSTSATVASIVRFITAPDGTHPLIAQGEKALHRARLRRPQNLFSWRARRKTANFRCSTARSKRADWAICARRPWRPCSCCRRRRATGSTPSAASSPISALADMVVSFMDLKAAEKQEVSGHIRLEDAPPSVDIARINRRASKS